jgi:signal transduction histidine kinase
MMAEFGSAALRTDDLDALLQEACARVAETIEVKRTKVLEYRPETDDLLVRAGVGWNEGVVGQATLPTDMTSPPGRAFRTKQAVVIEDIQTAEGFTFSGLLRDHNITSLVNVPISTDGAVYGVLEVDSEKLRQFNTDDQNFLAGFANLIAAAVQRQKADLERIQLLEQLRQAKHLAEEASRAKGRLLTATGHDLRQPLQAILIALDLLATKLTDASSHMVLNRAMNAADRLDRALNRLLQVARLEAGAFTPTTDIFSPGPLIADIADEFRSEAQARGLRLITVPCSASIETDRGLLDTILQNLVGNAVKYTERGRVLIGCRRLPDSIRIEVHDTGIGIPDNRIASIFEAFQRVDPKRGDGFGLGLSIAQQAAEALDTRIEARSVVGKGSRFTIRFPRAARPPLEDTDPGT